MFTIIAPVNCIDPLVNDLQTASFTLIYDSPTRKTFNITDILFDVAVHDVSDNNDTYYIDRNEGNKQYINELLKNNNGDTVDKIKALVEWHKVATFVKTHTVDRDETHGYEHMRTVANNALLIWNSMSSEKVPIDLINVCWLHDVADHKYDVDGSIRTAMVDFLKGSNENTWELMLKVIKNASYSSEKKIKEELNVDFVDYIPIVGEYGALLRDILSDADKLEAIGKQGYDRCYEFVKHKNPTLSENEIIKRVIEHANEKLIWLLSQYIRTPKGKELAEPLHVELLECLHNAKQSY